MENPAQIFYVYADFLHASARFCDLLEAMHIEEMQFVPWVVRVDDDCYSLKMVFCDADEIRVVVNVLPPREGSNGMCGVSMVTGDATRLLDWGVKPFEDPTWKDRWKMTEPVRRYLQQLQQRRESTLAMFEELPLHQTHRDA